MSKKLTILIEDSVYEGLHRVVGRGSIGKFNRMLTAGDLGRACFTRRSTRGQ